MKIENVEAIPVRLPCRTASSAGDARGVKALDYVLVRVDTDAGISGWGDAFAYAGTAAAAKGAVDHLVAPKIIGHDARDIAGISDLLQRQTHVQGRYGITTFAVSGVDIALWDIAGKAAGVPVSRLLGGPMRDSVPAYASLLRFADPEKVAAAASEAQAQGYPAIKLHEITFEAAAAARDVLGQSVPLMMDCNCPWTPVQARAMARQLLDLDLHWLEEPVFPPEDFESLATVRDEGICVASGENACTAFQFQAIFAAGAVDYAQPSVTKVGGITEMRKVLAIAETHGITVVPHAPYFGPGMLATLQVLAAMPQETYFERYFVDIEASLFGGMIEAADGRMRIPDGPGLGGDPDPDVIRDCRFEAR